MSRFDILDLLMEQEIGFNFNEIIISLVLSILLSFVLGKLYVKYGKSLSNRRHFANNIVLLGVTTTLVISIIKSSLALSLGLVGSLSIIRFRTAIKEPEELAFLFLTIAIGLGCGAYHWWLTTISFIIIGSLIIIRGLKKKDENQNLYITISARENERINLKKITEILNFYCNQVRLKRFDFNENDIEASFVIDIKSFDRLNNIKNKIKRLAKNATITYLDYE